MRTLQFTHEEYEILTKSLQVAMHTTINALDKVREAGFCEEILTAIDKERAAVYNLFLSIVAGHKDV